MTIQEIERLTGLPRASIRYYESEGLITPTRAENRYRDYTDADMEKLRKIRLLRSLDISIEDIRRIDTDEAFFSGCLKNRAERLSGEKERLNRVEAVITAMLADGASYSELDTEKYMKVLTEPLSPDPPPAPQEPETAHPGLWRRYFARSLDTSLLDLILYFIWGVLLKNNYFFRSLSANVWKGFLLGLMGMLLSILLEPIFLCFLGTTPGKWLLGIRVTDLRGNRLRYSEALWRTWALHTSLYGLHIPLLSTYLIYKNYKAIKDGDNGEWENWSDLRFEGDTALKTTGYIGLTVITFLLSFALMFYIPRLPPNRGELTKAEYVENINYYQHQVYDTYDNKWYLTDDLTWQVRYPSENVTYTQPSRPIIELVEKADGSVQQVTLRFAREGYFAPYDVRTCIRSAVMGAVCAQKGFSPFSDDYRKLEEQTDRLLESYHFSMHQVTADYQLLKPTAPYAQNNQFVYEELSFLMTITIGS